MLRTEPVCKILANSKYAVLQRATSSRQHEQTQRDSTSKFRPHHHIDHNPRQSSQWRQIQRHRVDPHIGRPIYPVAVSPSDTEHQRAAGPSTVSARDFFGFGSVFDPGLRARWSGAPSRAIGSAREANPISTRAQEHPYCSCTGHGRTTTVDTIATMTRLRLL